MAFNGGRTKLQYALTTPYMPDYNDGNFAVEDDNKIASDMMKGYGIPTVDLYQRVVEFCGPVPYTNCSICRMEPCSYHYTSSGYDWIAVPVQDEIRKNLNLGLGMEDINGSGSVLVHQQDVDLYFGDLS